MKEVICRKESINTSSIIVKNSFFHAPGIYIAYNIYCLPLLKCNHITWRPNQSKNFKRKNFSPSCHLPACVVILLNNTVNENSVIRKIHCFLPFYSFYWKHCDVFKETLDAYRTVWTWWSFRERSISTMIICLRIYA